MNLPFTDEDHDAIEERRKFQRNLRIARMILLSLLVGFMVFIVSLCTGCTVLTPNAATSGFEHLSHPAVGFPVTSSTKKLDNGQTVGVEDTLDLFQNCLERDTRSYFWQGCVSVKLRDGGFYGPPVVAELRFGKRWTWGAK